MRIFTDRFFSRPQMYGLSVFAIGLALLSGMLVSVRPWIGIVSVSGIAGLLVLSVLSRRTEALFLGSLVVLIVGFLFYSKAFSYIGRPPLFVSEPVLILGLLSLVFSRIRGRINSLHLLILGFASIGLVRTIPYLSSYGMDALRDAATWYYALFAIIISQLLSRQRITKFFVLYAWLAPALTIWLAVMPVLFRYAPTSLRALDARPFPFFYTIKAGDRAVILMGLAAFVITGLYTRFRGPGGLSPAVFWLSWGACALFVAAGNRGGMLAIAIPFMIIVLLCPSRELFQGAMVGIVLLSTVLVTNPSIDTGGARAVSVEQIRLNLVSVFKDNTGNTGSVQGTKEWRLQWWKEIVSQTVAGPYFLSGQGFGINLADEYGYQVDQNHSLRSPHSIHMTILARMGVPGFILWIGINIMFASQLLRIHWRAKRIEQQVISGIAVWLLAVWAASLVNGSFDVYLEGPYGAIPFWCVVGVGMALPALLRESGDNADPARA